MPIFQVVILAVVQGLTEFLPISSSAHLALAPWLLGWPDQGLTFDIALHLGTLAAVLVYFFKVWLEVIFNGIGIGIPGDPRLRQNRSLLWFLVAGTIPVGVAGVLLKDYAETTLRNPFVIGTMLIVVGLLMLLAERTAHLRKDLGVVSFADAMVIGFSQALAVIPGTSRSGITMTFGLFRGLDRPAAAAFSFLLATPAVAGAGLKAAYDLFKHGGVPADMRMPFALGMGLSFVTGLLVITVFLRYLQRGTLMFFVYYRIAFGILVIALAAFFRQPAG